MPLRVGAALELPASESLTGIRELWASGGWVAGWAGLVSVGLVGPDSEGLLPGAAAAQGWQLVVALTCSKAPGNCQNCRIKEDMYL